MFFIYCTEEKKNLAQSGCRTFIKFCKPYCVMSVTRTFTPTRVPIRGETIMDSFVSCNLSNCSTSSQLPDHKGQRDKAK